MIFKAITVCMRKSAHVLLLFVCALNLLLPAAAQTNDYEKALHSYDKERFDDAYIYLKSSLQSHPSYLPARILMGKILYQRKEFSGAEQEFSDAYSAGADIELYLDLWGLSLIAQERYDEVIDFELPISLSEQHRLNWLGLSANACSLLNRLSCAKNRYNQLLAVSPSSSTALNGLANIALINEEYGDALNYVELALKGDKENANSWQLKGQIAKAQGQLSKAKTYLIHAFNLDPRNPFISRNLADIYLAMGDNLAASNIVNNILSASPHDPFALLINSWLQQQNETVFAVDEELITLAGKINSIPSEIVNERPPLLYLRALVAYLLGSLEQAVRDFTRIQSISKPDIQVSILLAKTSLALGKEKSALAILERHESELLDDIDGALLLGELYLSRGKVFKGVELLKQLLLLHPNNVDIKLYSVKLLLARQKSSESLQRLDSILADHPNNERVLITHSVINLLVNNVGAAKYSSEKLLTMQPNNASYLNLHSSVLTRQNHLEQALSTAQRALKLQPSMVAAQYNLANIWHLQGDADEAFRLLRLILQDHRLHVPSLLLSAKINYEREEFDLAVERYKTVLSVSIRNVKAHEGLLLVALKKHNSKDALYQVDKLLALDPDNIKYIVQKVQLHQIRDETSNATKMLDKLAFLGRNNPQALFALAKLYVNQGENQKALAALTQAQTLAPDNAQLALQVIELMLNNHLSKEAKPRIDELAERFPSLANVPFMRGRAAEQEQDIATAQRMYEYALKLDPQFDLALGKLFSFARQEVAVSSFLTHANKTIEQQPTRYFPRSLLAQYYYYNHQHSLALVHYEALLSLSEVPDKAALLNRLAWLYMPNNLPKSADFAAQAYEIDRNDVNVLDTYGWTLTQLGSHKEALTILREAALRNATSELIKYHLAYTLLQLNRINEGKHLLESALSTDSDFYGRSEAQTLMSNIDM